ncbi:MAG TPA: hypothetical protein VN903_02635 [Polyangia bacterium]|jgi:hypothetical protein|nr:hypothetical protein [Polyangia bacterium]
MDTPFDFSLFKRKHFKDLAKACNNLRRFHDAREQSKPYSRTQVRAFLALVQDVLAFEMLLPRSSGGRDKARKLARMVQKFRKTFGDGRPSDEYLWRGLRTMTAGSWRAAHEMSQLTFEIHLYMAAVCDCPEKDGPYV